MDCPEDAFTVMDTDFGRCYTFNNNDTDGYDIAKQGQWKTYANWFLILDYRNQLFVELMKLLCTLKFRNCLNDF